MTTVKRPRKLNYASQLKLLKTKINDSIYKNDVIVNALIKDFERMVEINNQLMKELKENGYTIKMPSGVKPSPCISAFNKNHSIMAKTCMQIQEYLDKIDSGLGESKGTW